MKVLSTFGEVNDDDNLLIRSIRCEISEKPGKPIRAEDTSGGFYFKNIPPGKSFSLEIDLDTRDADPEKIAVNWFCNATKTRGAFFYDHEKQSFSGKINGKMVRRSLHLTPQILDELGRVRTSGSRSVLWLEGRHAFFPTIGLPMNPPHSHAFVYLEYDATEETDAIFSKETVRAVYNSNSRFCDSETGSPYGGTTAYFSLYEVWRQFIEVILNNDYIEDFDFDDDSGDTRIITVISRVLKEIFPYHSYTEIKKLRQKDYPLFCSQIQSYFFERCKE